MHHLQDVECHRVHPKDLVPVQDNLHQDVVCHLNDQDRQELHLAKEDRQLKDPDHRADHRLVELSLKWRRKDPDHKPKCRLELVARAANLDKPASLGRWKA